MLEKIGRNDPCPCGSGVKYKKCCLKREEELKSRRRTEGAAVSDAFDWLMQHYPQQVSAAIETGFFAALEKTDRELLSTVSPSLQGRIQFNFRDWLINDASLEVDGEKRAVSGLLAGPGGLEPEELTCLAAMGEFPLSLYEVQSVKPGEGAELADLLRPDTEPVWVIERIASHSLAPSDVFGARLLRRDNVFVMSGAVYPFTRGEALACRDAIVQEMADVPWNTETARTVASSQIIQHWLKWLIATCIPPREDAPAGGQDRSDE